jgi:nucleoside-diphosphate-sugar epimerase
MKNENNPQTFLVVGATGATGRFLVDHLLAQGHYVKAVVRSLNRLPDQLKGRDNLTFIEATLLDLNDEKMATLVEGCNGIASCLGHNMSWKGIYGHPRRLVTEATRRLCEAVMANSPNEPVRYVLMNTTGNRNRDLDEPISLAQRFVIFLLRLLLPPHVDNEQAAEYLRTKIGHHHPSVQWAAVRPDNLVDERQVTRYTTHPSPTRSAIFDAGKISRINVAHFMATLLTKKGSWEEWRGRMPVVYGIEEESVVHSAAARVAPNTMG